MWVPTLGALLSAAVGPLAAQSTTSTSAISQPSATPLDLSGALQLARQHAPGLRIADARRDASIGRARELAQFVNPTVEYRRENLGSSLARYLATVYSFLRCHRSATGASQCGSAG
jgi:hypothetical protein